MLDTREPTAFHDRKRLRARRRMSGPMGGVGPETVRQDLDVGGCMDMDTTVEHVNSDELSMSLEHDV